MAEPSPSLLAVSNEVLEHIARFTVEPDLDWSIRVKQELPLRLVHSRFNDVFTPIIMETWSMYPSEAHFREACTAAGQPAKPLYSGLVSISKEMPQWVSHVRKLVIVEQLDSERPVQYHSLDHRRWRAQLLELIDELLYRCERLKELELDLCTFLEKQTFVTWKIRKLQHLTLRRRAVAIYYGVAMNYGQLVRKLLDFDPLVSVKLDGVYGMFYSQIPDRQDCVCPCALDELSIEQAELGCHQYSLHLAAFAPRKILISLSPATWNRIQSIREITYEEALKRLAKLLTTGPITRNLEIIEVCSAKGLQADDLAIFQEAMCTNLDREGMLKKVKVTFPSKENMEDLVGAEAEHAAVMKAGVFPPQFADQMDSDDEDNESFANPDEDAE